MYDLVPKVHPRICHFAKGFELLAVAKAKIANIYIYL